MPKVTINLSQGLIEVEGSEEFVSSQVDIFQKTMLPAVQSITDKVAQLKISARTLESDQPVVVSEDVPSQTKHNDVFSMDSTGQIHILGTIGTKPTDKTRSLALLYLLAKKELKNENSASAQELREQCKKHGCFDASNFARILEGLKIMVMPIGKTNSKNKSYELTVPGKNEALKIAEELSKNVKNT